MNKACMNGQGIWRQKENTKRWLEWKSSILLILASVSLLDRSRGTETPASFVVESISTAASFVDAAANLAWSNRVNGPGL